MVGRFFRYLLVYPLFAVVVCASLTALWLNTRDPLSSLPPPRHDLSASPIEPVVMNGRRLEHLILSAGPLGDIGIFVNLPDPLPEKKIPVLIVLGGLGTGENNIRMIDNPGDNAIIGYDWPIPVPVPQGRDLIHALPDLYHRAMIIPGQVASAMGWLMAQPWADEKRLSVLGYSLGALAAPAIENIAQHDGHHAGWTIIAYGGAPLGALFAANPHMKPAWLRAVMGPVIDLLLHPLEPTVNLPQLSGHFLVLEGHDDALMSEAARTALRDAVPAPKDVIVFNGAHMGVGADKQALMEEIIRASRRWLIDSGAGNPPAVAK